MMILTVTYMIASLDCCATMSSWFPPFPAVPTRWWRKELAIIVGLHSWPKILCKFKKKHNYLKRNISKFNMLDIKYNKHVGTHVCLLSLCTKFHTSFFKSHCVSTVSKNHCDFLFWVVFKTGLNLKNKNLDAYEIHSFRNTNYFISKLR